MKKIIAVLLAAILLFSLTGCGARQKAADRLAEKIAEGILDNVAGDGVDIDGDKVKVKGDDGSEWSVGRGDWPHDQAGALLPELKTGKIASVLNSSEGCWVTIEDVNAADYNNYVEALKQAGFDQEAVTSTTDDGMAYMARMEGKAVVTIDYHNGLVMITLAVEEEGA